MKTKSLSDWTRRAVMTLLAVITTTAIWAENHIQSNIEICKGGIGEVCISGWAYDTKFKALEVAEDYGIAIRAVVSTTLNHNDVNYDETESFDMEYVERTDVNGTFTLSGNHGFRTRVYVYPHWFGESGEMTVYVRIYATFNEGYEEVEELLNAPYTAVNVRMNPGGGTEDWPFVISNAADWNSIAGILADNDLAPFYPNCFFRMANAEEDDSDYDNLTAVTKMWGTSTHPFTGHFDGKGQTLNVNLNGTLHVAPFSYTDGATIQNLTVDGSIYATQYAGGIVGHGGSGQLTMDGCVFAGTISDFANYAGGLLGWCDNLTLSMHNCLFKGSFTPGNGGKYHQTACKYGAGTVDATITRIFYLNTISPTATGSNLIDGADGKPVNKTLVEGEWDEPVVAADGITYYAAHVTKKSLPYSYGFETALDEEGWMTGGSAQPSIVSSSQAHGGSHYFGFSGDDGSSWLISPKLICEKDIHVSFYYIYNNGATAQIGYSTTDNAISSFTWTDYSFTSQDDWTQFSEAFPAGTNFLAVRCSGGVMSLDDFSFSEVVALADNADNTEKITSNAGQTHDVMLQGLTLYRNGNLNALCVPFDVVDGDASDGISFSGTPLEGATAWTLKSAELVNGQMTMDLKEAKTIKAGQPYFVRWTNSAQLVINTGEDWGNFVKCMEDGETFAGKNVLLNADINYSSMSYPNYILFCGTFDGNGHTLNIDIYGFDGAVAPFPNIRNATIQNLKVTGNVVKGDYCGGIVGKASGTNNIRNCWSDVHTDFTPNSGGILGNGATSTTTISNCYVTGDLNAHSVGIFYGWGDEGGTHTVENCWANGTYFATENINLLRTNGGTVSITNCYKNTNDERITQGTYNSEQSNEQILAVLGDQWAENDEKQLILKPSTTIFDLAEIQDPVFPNVTISGTGPTPVTFSGGHFVGCYSPVTITTSDLFLRADNSLGYPTGDMTLNAFRAYFHLGEVLMGDVNSDGNVTPADAIMILYHYFGVLQNGFNAAAADLNGDNSITPADAIEALYKYFGAGSNGARATRPMESGAKDPE